jgi:hypothetical protein
MEAELATDVFAVIVDGENAQIEIAGDLLARLALTDELKDFLFSGG